jgi:hypothetical protein
MKGWMQTFIVHSRHPLIFIGDIGWRGFLAFEIYVGSLIVSALLHTAFLVTALLRLVFLLPQGQLDAWGILYIVVLIFGYGAAMALVGAGLMRLDRRRLLLFQLTLPFYWVLHSAATVRAAHELLIRPFFWAKTEHGCTRLERSRAEARFARMRKQTLAAAGTWNFSHSNKG